MGGKYFSHIETSLKAKNGKNSTITIFNVKDNGAKGDGVTDDSKVQSLIVIFSYMAP